MPPVVLNSTVTVPGRPVGPVRSTVMAPLKPSATEYLGALKDEDAVAEGWITQRGRSVIFCEAEAIAAQSGRRVARAVLTYKVAG